MLCAPADAIGASIQSADTRAKRRLIGMDGILELLRCISGYHHSSVTFACGVAPASPPTTIRREKGLPHHVHAVCFPPPPLRLHAGIGGAARISADAAGQVRVAGLACCD